MRQLAIEKHRAAKVIGGILCKIASRFWSFSADNFGGNVTQVITKCLLSAKRILDSRIKILPLLVQKGKKRLVSLVALQVYSHPRVRILCDRILKILSDTCDTKHLFHKRAVTCGHLSLKSMYINYCRYKRTRCLYLCARHIRYPRLSRHFSRCASTRDDF